MERLRYSTPTREASSPARASPDSWSGTESGSAWREGTFGMDGKGRYSDNIFVERLWRAVKYEEVYLKAYTDGRQAKAGLDA